MKRRIVVVAEIATAGAGAGCHSDGPWPRGRRQQVARKTVGARSMWRSPGHPCRHAGVSKAATIEEKTSRISTSSSGQTFGARFFLVQQLLRSCPKEAGSVGFLSRRRANAVVGTAHESAAIRAPSTPGEAFRLAAGIRGIRVMPSSRVSRTKSNFAKTGGPGLSRWACRREGTIARGRHRCVIALMGVADAEDHGDTSVRCGRSSEVAGPTEESARANFSNFFGPQPKQIGDAGRWALSELRRL